MIIRLPTLAMLTQPSKKQRICRLCVSVKMHCQGMTMEEGTKFFMDNWYQGEKPSLQEALRGTFDPGYLFYTVGKLQIMKLRNDYQKQEGNNYSLKKFHDLMLDNGMPPIRLLREKLLRDKSEWDKVMQNNFYLSLSMAIRVPTIKLVSMGA